LQAWQEAQGFCADLVRDEPTDVSAREALARCLGAQGAWLLQMGRVDQAESKLLEALEHWEVYARLAALHPDRAQPDETARQAWFQALASLAQAETQLGRRPQAIAACQRARDLVLGLLPAHPCTPAQQVQFAGLAAHLGFVMQGDLPAEARVWLQQACAAYEAASPSHPVDSDPGLRRSAVAAIYSLACAEDHLNHAEPALRGFQRAAAIFEVITREDPGDTEARTELSTSYHIIGRLHVEGGRPAQALEPYHKAIAIREALHQADPRNSAHRYDCGGSWYRLGEALENLDRSEEAHTAYQKGLAYRRPLVAQVPRHIRYRQGLEEQLRDLSRLLVRMGRSDEAVAAARERMILQPDDPKVAWSVASDLGAAVILAGWGQPGIPPVVRAECRRYAAESLQAMWEGWTLLIRAHPGQGSHPRPVGAVAAVR
jgi:tetratricopeptide (TPR) repeat protein